MSRVADDCAKDLGAPQERRERSVGRRCDGAGRTFVQDGFDARTGDEREPGRATRRTESTDIELERRGRAAGGRGSEGEGASCRRVEARKARAKRRKLKLATGLRNIRIRHSS